MEKVFNEKYGKEVSKEFIIDFYGKLKSEEFLKDKKPFEGIPFNVVCELYIISTKIADPERYKEVCEKVRNSLIVKRTLIDEVFEQVNKELGGKKDINVSAGELIGSISNKKDNQTLKNKTGIDFGSLIQNISKNVEEKISKGELDVSEVKGLLGNNGNLDIASIGNVLMNRGSSSSNREPEQTLVPKKTKKNNKKR